MSERLSGPLRPFHAIVVAAGTGSRSGLHSPKQYHPVHGRPMMAWSVDTLLGHPACQKICIVIGAAQQQQAEQALSGMSLDRILWATGGDTRQQSVRNGLAALAACSPATVLIHDAARPFLPPIVIDRLLDALETHEGAVPVLPVADTLAESDVESTNAGAVMGPLIDRSRAVRVQTPQAFCYVAIHAAHQSSATEATDDAQLLRASGQDVALVEGSPMLEKYTFAEDFAPMATRLPRSGNGFDVHRLIAGDGMQLCGVWIASDWALLGHSDADVGLHAITDAVLGAIAEGDIGDHFPPTDPQWEGAASDLFLRHAVELAKRKGFVIAHVDCTLICERPKIGPHRAAMREKVAQIMDLSLDCVSIKATTTEQLGFTGRGEGIAAQAIVTVG